MKKIFDTIITLLLIYFSGNTCFADTITSFGSGPATGGTWTYNNGAFSGSSIAGDLLYESLASTVDITGQDILLLDLSPTSIVGATSFTVILLESLGGSHIASASFSNVQLESGLASSSLVDLGGDFANVNAWMLSASGSPSDSFNIASMNSLSAVPEPSTYALFAGIFALGYIVVRRSRSRA